MQFRTIVKPTVSTEKIALTDKIVTIGSCFADTMGDKLTSYKLDALINPFGTIYNPLSIHDILLHSINQSALPESGYGILNGLNFNHHVHSSFSSPDKNELHQNIERATLSTNEHLKASKYLFITYGTSFIYIRKDNNEYVANCHKVPADHFTKELLTQKKIIESFEELHRQLMKFNRSLQIILTVSPVRHLKDTLALNSVSKSVLRIACHTLSEQFENVTYFPAYEILLDDLRDYRFYADDLLHPSNAATEYIWERFAEAWFSENDREFFANWDDISKSLAHRPFHPNSQAHQQLLHSTLVRLEKLNAKVDVSDEIEMLKKQMIT